MTYYICTLVVFGAVDVLAILALNLQFGVGGVVNFGLILWQALGAYVAAVLSLPSDHANGGFQTYIGGLHLPFPLPWIGALIAGAAFSYLFAPLMTGRLRRDNAAIAFLVSAIVLNNVVDNYQPLFNGNAGLSLVPAPFGGQTGGQSSSFQVTYAVVATVVAVAGYFVISRLVASPYGRRLRAMRENDAALEALGSDVRRLRTGTLVVGGALSALSGAILVGFINVWSPAAWGPDETIVLFAAIIVGGLGNIRGAVLGAILVPVALLEGTTFIPDFGPPGLIPALDWVLVGALILGFLYWRPEGIVPERVEVVSPRRSRLNAVLAGRGGGAER